MVMPIISGVISRPELLAVAPITTCMNSGRKMVAPTAAAPIRKPRLLPITKTLLRKSRSGSSGSSARSSCRISSPINTTAATARPRICGEVQANSLPPQVVMSSSATIPGTSKVAPR